MTVNKVIVGFVIQSFEIEDGKEPEFIGQEFVAEDGEGTIENFYGEPLDNPPTLPYIAMEMIQP